MNKIDEIENSLNDNLNINFNNQIIHEEKENDENAKVNEALLMVFISACFYVFSAIAVKKFKQFNSDGLMWHFAIVRHITVILLSVIYMKMRNIEIERLDYFSKEPYWFFFRTLNFSIGVWLWAISFANLKLGIASLILNLHPLFSNFLAYFILKEPLKSKYIIACIICLFGIFLMVSKSKKNDETNKNLILGSLTGLLNSIIIPFANIGVKKIGSDLNTHQLSLMTSIYGGFFTFFIIIIFYGISSFYVLLEFNFLLYSVLSGGLSCVAFNFAQIAFTIKVDMSKIVNVFYIQVPLSSLLGFFLFGETITFLEIIGGSTIIFTVLYVNVFSK